MSKTKVKMLTGISGLPNPAYDLPEHSYAPGEVVSIHPKLASAWIQGGIAEAVREKSVQVEATTTPAAQEASVQPPAAEAPAPSTTVAPAPAEAPAPAGPVKAPKTRRS